jgi:hypothetical protein
MTNFGPLRTAVASLVLLVLAVLAVPQAASASAVLYTFTTTEVAPFSTLTLTSSFSFKVPAIITGTGETIITSLLSASNTGTFWTSNHCGPISIVDVFNPTSADPIIEERAGNCFVTFGFSGPIDTFGTFAVTAGEGTLTIGPEPATVLLFGSGLLLFGIIVRRKQLHARRIGLIGVT